MVLINVDIFSGEEICDNTASSNTAPFSDESLSDIAFALKSSVVEKFDEYGTSSGDEEDAVKTEPEKDSASAIYYDLIENFGLVSIKLTESAFSERFKLYTSNILGHLSKNGSERIEIFKNGLDAFHKAAIARFKDLHFYVSGSEIHASEQGRAMTVIGYWEAHASSPTLVYLRDGLQQMRY